MGEDCCSVVFWAEEPREEFFLDVVPFEDVAVLTTIATGHVGVPPILATVTGPMSDGHYHLNRLNVAAKSVFSHTGTQF